MDMDVRGIIFAILSCSMLLFTSCEELGVAKQSDLDSAHNEIKTLNQQIEQLTSEKRNLELRIDELEDDLRSERNQTEEYRDILVKACRASDNLKSVIDNPDHTSFGELSIGIEELREALGFQEVYNNTYSPDPFSSRTTVVTRQPDYLFK